MNAFTDPALFRFLLVVSVAIAFAVYTRFHLVGGGSVAGGYLAILVITAQWQTLLGVALVTLLTISVLRAVILRVVALPRSAIFILAVLTGALLTEPARVGKPLRGDLAGIHSARRGTYRVLYRINNDKHEVVVLRVDHRRDIYRQS